MHVGMKKKWWNTGLVPDSNLDLLNLVEILEKAAGDGSSKSNVTVTVDGATSATVNLSADRLTDIVLVLKTALNNDD